MRVCAIGVVVPVHNEAELLERCLAGIASSIEDLRADRSDVAVHVVVVLDACTDGSAGIAARFGFDIVRASHLAVGCARRSGVAAVLELTAGLDHRAVWLANTDADSCVPRHWLREQLMLAEAGADLVVGTVRPDRGDLTDAQFARWESSHGPGVANGHVHGANLGVRLAPYLASGGFPGVPEHEDVRLVERLRAAGVEEVASDRLCVVTSGRFVGRSPGGYAHHLAVTLADDLTPPADLRPEGDRVRTPM